MFVFLYGELGNSKKKKFSFLEHFPQTNVIQPVIALTEANILLNIAAVRQSVTFLALTISSKDTNNKVTPGSQCVYLYSLLHNSCWCFNKTKKLQVPPDLLKLLD